MHSRIVIAVAALSFASALAAQDTQSDAVRQSMFDAADKIVRSASERGFVDRLLDVDRAASLQFTLDNPERQNWQYWPAPRVGLPLENMPADQRGMTHELLKTIYSTSGYLKAVHIMQLEEILEIIEYEGLPRSVDHYRLAIFGSPSMTDAWAWRFEGHHVSLNVSVSPDGVTVTPSFFGSNPAEVTGGPLAGFRVHGTLEDRARELVQSLTGRQRTQAIIGDTAPSEILTGNIGKDPSEWEVWRESLQPEGVAVADLNEVQRHWVGLILDEVIGNYRVEISLAERTKIDDESLHFAWMGGTERGEKHYFRLQGEDFLLEFDNTQDDGNHVHSVWRSKSSDFGMGILERHYQTSHLQ